MQLDVVRDPVEGEIDGGGKVLGIRHREHVEVGRAVRNLERVHKRVVRCLGDVRDRVGSRDAEGNRCMQEEHPRCAHQRESPTKTLAFVYPSVHRCTLGIASITTINRGFSMATQIAARDIQAFTASAFSTPRAFTDFASGNGKPLGALIGGESVTGTMNATFQTIDPGTQEVLATVCEMGKEDVDRAVTAAYKAFNGTNGKNGWKDTPVERRCELIAKLIELTDRDRDVLLACEIKTAARSPSWPRATWATFVRAPSISWAWPGRRSSEMGRGWRLLTV